MTVRSSDRKPIELSSQPRFKVGAATVDCVSREATFNGTTERLQPQNLKVLVALAQAAGRVVTRDELIDRCWDGRVIGDDVINRATSTLRQFAGRAGGFEIETVPRSGYRLTEGGGRKWKPRWAIGTIMVACSLGALVAIYEVRQRSAAEPTMLTVEVLPFDISTSDATDRQIAFATHNSVSHALSQTRFSVVESQRNEQHEPPADFLLAADFSSTPQAVTATVRMEQAAHHIIVYSRQFTVPRDQIWTLPEMVGPQVAGSLGWTVPLLLTDHRYPSNPQILAALLQDSGQADWLGQYERTRHVATTAPNSAVAQFALAMSTGFYLRDLPLEQRGEAVAVARTAAAKAELLDPKFGDADIPWCLLHSRSQMIECQDRLRAAMRRDPDSPWVEYFLADSLKNGGRADQALVLARHALASDQFVPYKIALVLRLLEATGRSEEADQLYRKARVWWPGHPIIIWDRVYGIMDRGDFKALAKFNNELASDGLSTELKDSLDPIPSVAAAVSGKGVGALRSLCPLAQPRSFRLDLCLIAFSRIGDLDDAFAAASRAFPDRVGRSPAEEEGLWLADPYPTDTDILTEDSAAALRRDPRFLDLVRRLGILAYWKSGRLPDFCQPPRPEAICKSFGT